MTQGISVWLLYTQMHKRGWTVRHSKSHNNRPYYFNEITGITQWELPVELESETFSTKGKVHVYHILVKHANSRRPSSWRQEVITCTESEALEEIKRIRSEIYSTAAASSTNSQEIELFELFKQRASERSDCFSAKRGGDLGPFGAGEMQSNLLLNICLINLR